MSRAFVLCLSMGLGCAAVPSTTTCSAETCDGCCDAQGACQRSSHERCGGRGGACVACSAAEECVFGSCLPSLGGGGGSASGGGGGGGGASVTGGGAATGGGGATGCTLPDCAGCCQDGACVTAVTTLACGQRGQACVTCSALGADNCDQGACRCGAQAACLSGARCLGGACVCDSTSCPTGCCVGNACVAAPTAKDCGLAGRQCMSCDENKANNCGTGSCRCGTGALCGDGQRCLNGACVCDRLSCDGCCDGTACVMSGPFTQCGRGGRQCAACSAETADTCGPLGCQCGSVPACPAGVTCLAGICGGPRSWKQVNTATRPTTSVGAVATFDAARNRTVVFGGSASGTLLNETWEYDGTTWRLAATTGPAARAAAAMAYDPVRQQSLLFGGRTAAGVVADTWAWNGVAWSKLSPATSPPARERSALAWDETKQHLVLFGGFGSQYLSDTWEWTGSTWVAITPTRSPYGLADFGMASDPRRVGVSLFGGVAYNNTTADELWLFFASTWQASSASGGPGPLEGVAVAFDGRSGRLALAGGLASAVPTNRFWFFDNGWIAGPSLPSARGFSLMVYDSGRERLVLFGGVTATSALVDTWEY